MATQFEYLQKLLKAIHQDIIDLTEMVREISGKDLDLESEVDEPDFGTADESGMEGESFPIDPTPRPKQMNRREVEVRGFHGEPIMVQWSEIDPRIVKAVELSTKNGKDYELYEDQSGTVRISVEAEIAHMMRKAETFQQPVPQVGDRELDALGEDV